MKKKLMVSMLSFLMLAACGNQDEPEAEETTEDEVVSVEEEIENEEEVEEVKEEETEGKKSKGLAKSEVEVNETRQMGPYSVEVTRAKRSYNSSEGRSEVEIFVNVQKDSLEESRFSLTNSSLKASNGLTGQHFIGAGSESGIESRNTRLENLEFDGEDSGSVKFGIANTPIDELKGVTFTIAPPTDKFSSRLSDPETFEIVFDSDDSVESSDSQSSAKPDEIVLSDIPENYRWDFEEGEQVDYVSNVGSGKITFTSDVIEVNETQNTGLFEATVHKAQKFQMNETTAAFAVLYDVTKVSDQEITTFIPSRSQIRLPEADTKGTANHELSTDISQTTTDSFEFEQGETHTGILIVRFNDLNSERVTVAELEFARPGYDRDQSIYLDYQFEPVEISFE